MPQFLITITRKEWRNKSFAVSDVNVREAVKRAIQEAADAYWERGEAVYEVENIVEIDPSEPEPETLILDLAHHIETLAQGLDPETAAIVVKCSGALKIHHDNVMAKMAEKGGGRR